MIAKQTAQCDYCGNEVKPHNRRAKGHICETCLERIQVGERTDE